MLVEPDATFHASYLRARDEDPRLPQSWAADGLDLTRPEAFAELVRRLRADARDDSPRPAGWVPTTTLWWVVADEFLARVSIRHRLVGTLATLGGHIGYWVRPSARRRGHGSAAFRATLPYVYALGIDPALVTCDADNTGSRLIIEQGGGRFDNAIGVKRRYWVATNPRAVAGSPLPPRAEVAVGSNRTVQRLRHYLFVRHSHNWKLLFRFGLVGGSGVLVNMLAIIVANKVGPNAHGVAVDLPLTDFNIRWYHVYSTISFLLANLWNFQLNRLWTFRSAAHASWFREYLPFLAVGVVGLAANLGILTLLLHPGSFLSLPTSFFDDSTGFRTRLYWGQLIAIAVVTPLSFVLNKVWTFSAVRSRHKDGVREDTPAGTV